MGQLNRQEVYNTVRDHLLKQRVKGVDDYGSCAYRSENGLKCAIGALIKDEYYDPCFEGKGVYELADAYTPTSTLLRRALVKSLGADYLTHEDICFLSDLQVLHDENQGEFEAATLEAFAIKNGLVP